MIILDRTDRNSALLLGITHFFVDFACTALLACLSDHLSHSQILACAILYNGLAFAFQLPLGALGDMLGSRRGLAGLGCAMVALGALFSKPLWICLFIGLGNACFHVGGGREALERSGGIAAPVGHFVAPGALGIFLGPRLAGFGWLTRGVLPVCLLLLAAGLLLAPKKISAKPVSALPLTRLRLAGLMGCMFLTVLLRSYMGTVLRYAFLSETVLALLFTLSIFAGKFFGGILADRFGALRFSAVAQSAATVLFILSIRLPWLAFGGIFLFNTTMAITATELYRALPRFPGTMFGLTTFALYLGVLPRLLRMENVLFTWWGLGLLSLISTALLLGGLILIKGGIADAAVAGAVTGTDADP